MDKNARIDYRQKKYAEFIALIKVLKGILRFELLCFFYETYIDETSLECVINKFVFFSTFMVLLTCDILLSYIKKEKKDEYNFSFKREFSTYRHMKENWRRVKKGAESCDNYFQWKEYVERKYNGGSECQKENFKYYIDNQIKAYKEDRHIHEIVLIQLLILSVTLLFSNMNISKEIPVIVIGTSIIIVIALLEIFIIKPIYSNNNKIDFYVDFKKIVFPVLDEKTEMYSEHKMSHQSLEL